MIKVYYPKIFEGLSEVDSIFTESNRTEANENGSIPGLNLGYNTAAGDREVDQNFDLLFRSVKWNSSRIVLAKQVHGSHIEVVTSPGILPETDGLVTREPDLSLGIRVADCAAVLIADPVNKVAGAFHAGWKGAVADIIPKGIDQMKKVGAEPRYLYAFISPCISAENFEVGEEVAVRFPEKFVHRKGYTKPHIDLKAFIVNQLVQKGIESNKIECSGECTVDSETYFSFRRERDRAGRMLAMIKLN